MATFLSKRVTQSATIHLMTPPHKVFHLFEPIGEKLWAAGWNPVMLYPMTGVTEQGAVFKTHDHGEQPAIWIVTYYDPVNYHISYVRVAPDSHIAQITIRCSPDGKGTTSATVMYTFTGLTEAGNIYIDTYTEDHYREWIEHWESAINRYLKHGAIKSHNASS